MKMIRYARMIKIMIYLGSIAPHHTIIVVVVVVVVVELILSNNNYC